MKIDESNFYKVSQYAGRNVFNISDTAIKSVIRMCKNYVEDETLRQGHRDLGLCHFFSSVDRGNKRPSRNDMTLDYSLSISQVVVALYKMMYGRGPRHDDFISIEQGATKARINFCQRVVDYFEVKEAA